MSKPKTWAFKLEAVGKGETVEEAFEDAKQFLRYCMEKVEADELVTECLGEDA